MYNLKDLRKNLQEFKKKFKDRNLNFDINEFNEADKINRELINKKEKKLKLSKFGTFSIRQKKSRIGRNPKTKESKIISSRDVVLFKPSKEFKDFINLKDNG